MLKAELRALVLTHPPQKTPHLSILSISPYPSEMFWCNPPSPSICHEQLCILKAELRALVPPPRKQSPKQTPLFLSIW